MSSSFALLNQIRLRPFVELDNVQNYCSCRNNLYTWFAKPAKYLKDWLRKCLRSVRTHAEQRSACALINPWRAHETCVNEVLTVSVCVFSYRNLATEHETLMQKYLHLLQIVETEKTVAKQLRQQIEDGEIEIERLKSEVTRHEISF